jgi:amino acid transporter
MTGANARAFQKLMENSDQSSVPRRTLGSFDLTCLGWNSVIGSGIFLSQGDIAARVGPYGPLLFLIGGILCLPIALCFAQLAQRYSGMGGSCLYAREVFGVRAGFVVGWVMWLSGIIGGASVAVGFATFVAPDHKQSVAIALTSALATVNLVGTLGGAWSNNLLAMVKLGPLLLAGLLGLASLGPAATLWPAMAMPVQPDWRLGLLLVLYTYSGFEEIALPAGEARDPQRTVPKATLLVLISSALLYTVLQGVVSQRATWSLGQPLQAAFVDTPWLAQGLALAALVSLASVNASIAFTTPRSLWTLAHHGWLPGALLRLHRGAPSLSIVISASLTACLIMSQNLEKLMALSVLASLLQHLASTLACWKLRGWHSWPGIPQVAVAVCLLLLCTSEWKLLIGMAISLGVGVLITMWVGRPTRVDESADAW